MRGLIGTVYTYSQIRSFGLCEGDVVPFTCIFNFSVPGLGTDTKHTKVPALRTRLGDNDIYIQSIYAPLASRGGGLGTQYRGIEYGYENTQKYLERRVERY